MTTTARLSLLLVDDDEAFRERASRAMESRGWEVRTASNVEEGLAVATEDPPEFAVVDLRMPGESGLTLVEKLKELDPHTVVVVLTGYGSVATAVEAMRRGASHYLQKPVTLAELEAALRGALPPPTEAEPQPPSLARNEWEYIHKILEECGGNISEAARRLRVHRRSLQRKLQKHPPRR